MIEEATYTEAGKELKTLLSEMRQLIHGQREINQQSQEKLSAGTRSPPLRNKPTRYECPCQLLWGGHLGGGGGGGHLQLLRVCACVYVQINTVLMNVFGFVCFFCCHEIRPQSR